jgi:plasmid stabilization system protein ParE
LKNGSSVTLAFFPSRNPFEPLLRDEPIVYRFLVKGNYKIIYFVDNEEVVIVLVFDTRKCPNRLLSGG